METTADRLPLGIANKSPANAGAAPTAGSSGLTQLKRSLVGRSFEVQAAMLTPSDEPMQPALPVGGVPARAVQRQEPASGKTVPGTQVERITLEGLATLVAFDDKRGGRAIALVPKLSEDPAAPVEVLLYLHGRSYGNEGRAQADQMEQQLEASGRNMIGLMPQGLGTQFGAKSGEPGFNAEEFIAEALQRLFPDKPVKRGGTVLAAHSGGGDAASQMLAGAGSQSAPAELKEVLLFEAINKADGKSDELARNQAFLKGKLDAELARIREQPDPAAKEAWIQQHGLRYRAYYADLGAKEGRSEDERGNYYSQHASQTTEFGTGEGSERIPSLQKFLDTWFADHAADLGGVGDPVYEALKANYKCVAVDPRQGGWHENMVGKGALKEGLSHLPEGGQDPSAPGPAGAEVEGGPGAAPEGATAGSEASKPPTPWVDFTPDGRWNGERVVAAVGAVPSELRTAILAGPGATARFCIALRSLVEAKAAGDPGNASTYDEIIRALTSRATELSLGTPSSPLTFEDLRKVGRWWTEHAPKTPAEDAPATAATPAGQTPEGAKSAEPATASDTAAAGAQGPAAQPSPEEEAAAAEGAAYRDAIKKRLDHFRTHPYEAEGVKGSWFDDHMDPAGLESGRKSTAMAGRTFTSCNSFAGTLGNLANIDTNRAMAPVKVGFMIQPEATAAKYGAWTPADQGGTPEEGDLLAYPGHVGYFQERTMGPPPKWYNPPKPKGAVKEGEEATDEAPAEVEIWYTVDGGQGQPWRYKKETAEDGTDKVVLVAKGQEAIARAECVYLRDSHVLKQHVGGYTKERKLKGWVDIEKMAAALTLEANKKAKPK